MFYKDREKVLRFIQLSFLVKIARHKMMCTSQKHFLMKLLLCFEVNVSYWLLKKHKA